MTNYQAAKNKIYKFRKEMWDRKNEIQIPTAFYISKRDIEAYPSDMHSFALPDGKKKWIFTSQFSVAIENTVQRNYFTEKLLGCFETLTVPVYIGCPNISDYFDMRGMLIAKDVSDAIQVINTLTPETYLKMLPYLKKNKERVNYYVNLKKYYVSNFFSKNNS
jgi:hypothetical protein